MIIVKTRLLQKNVIAMALYPFIVVNKNKTINDRIINHEKIHLRQQIELLILPFYIWYIIEYLVKLIKYRNIDKAYRNISFEKEAYINEKNASYIKNRSFLSFIKYM
jgi:hypothetical protein